MKPTRRPLTTASRLAPVSLLACLALSACIPAPPPVPVPAPAPAPAAAPPPAPPPAPAPAPAAPVPTPSFSNWMDAPATPGDWTYAAGVATFGDPASGARLSLRCDRAAGAVEIFRAGTGDVPLQMILRTEFEERGLSAQPTGSDPPMVVTRLAARDPLLDAMAFSKGRFAVEVAGLAPLYLPSWPEVTRVVEDCR